MTSRDSYGAKTNNATIEAQMHCSVNLTAFRQLGLLQRQLRPKSTSSSIFAGSSIALRSHACEQVDPKLTTTRIPERKPGRGESHAVRTAVKTDMPTFADTFRPGPILQGLVKHLPIAGIRNLQLTCWQYADLYAWALPSKWNVDTYLNRFLLNPKAFRLELTQCNAIISGSAALGFFDQSLDWYPNDLDIYTTTGQCATQMHSHLLQSQNCVCIGTKTAKDARYAVNNIDEVRTYSVLGPKSGESEHVQLICLITQRYERQRCSWHCQEEILNGYHSTVVLNYMTGTQAVSLFPQSTFIQRKIYLQTPWAKGFKKRAVEKYVERGWRVADVLPSEDRKILHRLVDERSEHEHRF